MAPYELVKEVAMTGKLPVVNFAGMITPFLFITNKTYPHISYGLSYTRSKFPFTSYPYYPLSHIKLHLYQPPFPPLPFSPLIPF